MAKEDKKEPISDLTKHNLKREEEVRTATKRLDEYLVEKFDLNKPKSEKDKTAGNIKNEKLKNSEVKEGEQAAKSAESKNDKKSEKKEPEAKATEK